MKKLVSVLLAVLCALSVTACGGKNGFSKPDSFTSDGKLVIQYFAVDMDSLQSRTEDTKKIMKVIEDKFNVSFEILSGSANSWKQQLNQYIGGGDVPDVFFHTKTEPAYSKWLEEKYLFNFSEYLNDYPNLKNAFDRFPADQVKAFLGGDYYGYPIVMNSETDSSVINEHALYYRRDWYENLAKRGWTPSSGRPLVDPEDEDFNYLNFFDLCEGFTKGHPTCETNEAAAKDTTDTYGYALTKEGGVYWWYPLLSMFGVQLEGWEKSSGKWMPECISDQMKEAVMFVADMYDNGFVNSNYATTATQAVMKGDFANGVAGMMTYNATFPMGKGILDLMEQYQKDASGKVVKELSDVVRAMPVVKGKDGTKKMFGYPNYYGFLSINNDVSENKKKTVLSIMDWMLSEEGMMLLNYGIENVHYRKEGNELISLLGEDKSGHQKTLYDETVAPGIYRIKGLVSWSTKIPATINHYEEQMQLLSAWKSEYLFVDELSYVSPDTSFALNASTLSNARDKAFQQIVSKKTASEREKIWNNYVKNYKLTGDTYITEINNKAQSQLGL